MAELALGIAGIVPLGLLVFKAHKSAKRKLKTFRAYDNEAKRLQKEFDIQRQFFRNEWKILLKLVVQDAGVISSMNGDFSHENWSDPELNDQLRDVLEQNYETYLAILEAVHTASRDLESELERINSLSDAQEEEETLREKHALRRLRRVQDNLRVLRHSKGFATSIENLKSALSQLMALRGQLEKLTEPEKHEKKEGLTRSAAVSECLRIWSQSMQTRKATATLHAALAEVWNCSHAEHRKHLFKLFVETGEMKGEIHMRLAIFYDWCKMFKMQSSLAHLEVRSKDVTWVQHPCPAIATADEPSQRHTKRIKVVRFEETTISTSISHGSSQPGEDVKDDARSWTSSDLRCSQDICSVLTRAAPPSPSQYPGDSACLGHIEVRSERKYLHTFYSGFSQMLYSPSANGPSTVSDMIGDISRDLVDPIDKLRLARSVAMAVMNFHSTPWLGQVWQLQDMAMFVDDVEDLSKSLETLHVNVELARSCVDMTQSVRALSDCQTGHDERTDEEILCNIKNRPLYSLGVALLQIDRWARFDLGDVVAVRRTAELPSSISKKFRDITQRCLECNFGRGPGTNLSWPALQQAVCRSVVWELDNLILLAEEMNLVDPTDDDD